MTLSAAQVARLLDRHGIEPSKGLGQNFVVDPNTVRRVVDLAGVGSGDRVVEIGGGLGSLTTALLDVGAQVIVIEKDRALVPLLAEQVAGRAAEVITADALTVDWSSLLDEARYRLVANLPYNVATSIVIDVLDRAPQIERLLVMVQLEVGRRLVAGPGSRQRGAVSVLIERHAVARLAARVPPTVFLPRPTVDSALVELVRRPEPLGVGHDGERFVALVRAGFGQRRKMLRRSLAGLASEAELVAAGIDPTRRAETLEVAEWLRLAGPAPSSGIEHR